MATSETNGVNGVNGVNGLSHANGKPKGDGTAIPSHPHPKAAASYAAKFKLPDHFIGGNRLAVAAPGAVKNFVAENDGHTVITNVSAPQVRMRYKLKMANEIL